MKSLGSTEQPISDNKSTSVVLDIDKDEAEGVQLEKDNEVRARQFEYYLKASGFGFFHVLLLVVVGLATAADAVEVFSISFVLPIAGDDLDLTTAHKGWLDASIFIGMLIGGYVWGSLADAIGRKVTIVTAMLWNGLCGLASAFSPNFTFFLIFRLASGIGVGGSVPVVFSYVSEFFTEKQAGPIVVITAACWQPGIAFTAFLAWALLGTEGPQSEISFYIGSLHFVHWRLFLIICTLPAFISSISLLFLPESPAYLYHTKKATKLSKVLKQILRVNHTTLFCGKKPKTDEIPLVDLSKSLIELDREMLSIKGKEEAMSLQDCPLLFYEKAKQVCSATVGIFRLRYLRASLLLLVIWFTQMFGYYSLQLWFPEFFKQLHLDSNSTTVIQKYNESRVNHLQFYQDSLFTALASLPGNIAGALLINIIGARIQTAVALLLSAVSVFSIYGIPSTHVAVVIVSCMFSAISVTVFGALDVINTIYYDADLRSTAFGIHSGLGRLGAILGNVMFGHLFDVDRGVPILIVASLLTVGAGCAMLLPQIYRAENRSLLERAVDQLGAKCKKKICR